jgi:ornithine cyclodeaminase
VSILNDPATGYPLACVESSIISATRTAASAALAATVLGADRRIETLTIVGGGLIARYVLHYLLAAGLTFRHVTLYDASDSHAAEFAEHLTRTLADTTVSIAESAGSAVRSGDLVLLTTVAPEPYLTDASDFDHAPLVLNVSLRDVGVDVVLTACNIVDDVEHCLKADTSVHLAEQRTGNRDFLDGTLADVLLGRVQVPFDRTVVFSPFGLGVLDLAVAKRIYDELRDTGALRELPGFFHELQRLP